MQFIVFQSAAKQIFRVVFPVLTGEPFEVSDATTVAPKTALVVEYKR